MSNDAYTETTSQVLFAVAMESFLIIDDVDFTGINGRNAANTMSIQPLLKVEKTIHCPFPERKLEGET